MIIWWSINYKEEKEKEQSGVNHNVHNVGLWYANSWVLSPLHLLMTVLCSMVENHIYTRCMVI